MIKPAEEKVHSTLKIRSLERISRPITPTSVDKDLKNDVIIEEAEPQEDAQNYYF